MNKGTFLVCGIEAPQLQYLSDEQAEAFLRNIATVQQAGTAAALNACLEQTFGVQALYAFPAWIEKSMEDVVATYCEAHADAVKAIAKAIVEGLGSQAKIGEFKSEFDRLLKQQPAKKPAAKKAQPKGGGSLFSQMLAAGGQAHLESQQI